MKYSALVKKNVNVRVDGIEALSQESAIDAADTLEIGEIVGEMQRQTALTNSDGTPILIRHMEDGEETACYLVDEEGDEEFGRSQWNGKDGRTVLDPGNLCRECLRGLA